MNRSFVKAVAGAVLTVSAAGWASANSAPSFLVPPAYSQWRHFGRDVLEGTLILGLGLGMAGAVSNALSPSPNTMPSPRPAEPTGWIRSGGIYVAAPVPPVVYNRQPSGPVALPPAVAPGVATIPSESSVKFWCDATKSFYPQVTECPSGWTPTP